jgi:hypothetical protein
MGNSDLAKWLDKIVIVSARDWQLYLDAVSRNDHFEPMMITLYGLVVACNEVSLTIAPQVYADDRVRCAQCLPWSDVVSIQELQKRRKS